MATFSATSWNKEFWISGVTGLIAGQDSGLDTALEVLADVTPQTVSNTYISGGVPSGTFEMFGNHFTDGYDFQLNRLTISSPNISMDLTGDLREGGVAGIYGSYSQASATVNGIRITERGDMLITYSGDTYGYNMVKDIVMPTGETAKFESNSNGKISAVSLNIGGHSLTASGGDWGTESINTWQDLFTGDDTLLGSAGNDYLQGFEGNDFIDGGAGIDTAIFSGNHSDYTLIRNGSTNTVRDNIGTDGTETLINIEQLQFSDQTIDITLADFDGWEYLASNIDLIAVFSTDFESAKNHYANYGHNEGRPTDFDEWGYLAANNDLMAAFGADPDAAVRHYVSYGHNERRPTDFDEWGYLASNTDLMVAFGTDVDAATRHYVVIGHNEERPKDFDEWGYLAANNDLMAAFGADPDAAVKHYVSYGHNEGRPTGFDALSYLAANNDLQAAFGTDIEAATHHYVNYGHDEGRAIQLAGVPDVAVDAILIS